MNIQKVFIIVVLHFGEEFPAQFHLDDHAMIVVSWSSRIRVDRRDKTSHDDQDISRLF
jgi:hypothetical protein